MLYIYVELRYQRQLNKICPDIPVRFFSTISDSVRNNGGTITRIGQAVLYTFSSDSAGFAFSASRVLGEIRFLVNELRERVKEYFVIADASDGPVSPDSFKERLMEYDSVITPDESILLTPQALHVLSSYVQSVPLEGTDLQQYNGLRVAEYAPPAAKQSRSPVQLSLYTDGASDPVKLLRDLLTTAPEVDLSVLLDVDAFTLREENMAALEAYSWFRYTDSHPEYRKEAVLSLYSQQLRALGEIADGPVPVVLRGSEPLHTSCSVLVEMLSDLCSFSEPESQVFLPDDTASMPPDLLDMAYLVYRIPEYIYYDEYAAFFQFLGKDATFVHSLGSWLYSYGILSDPQDFRSINRALKQRVLTLCSDASREVNDRRIADFIWLHYETGSLMPTIELLDVFTELQFTVSDSFLSACFFNCHSLPEQRNRCLHAFTSRRVRDAIEQLASGEKAVEQEEYGLAEKHAREVLHVFQQEKIPYGEYRAFSLLSRLAQVKNKGDDGVAYLEYAQESAAQTRYRFSMLETAVDLACIRFRNGNFDASLSDAERAEKIAQSCFSKEHEAFLLFLKGRIYFEIGDYRNAGLVFQTSATIASLYRFPERVAMARIWYGRVLSHEMQFHKANELFLEYRDSVPEAPLFLLENAILSGHALSDTGFREPQEIMKSKGVQSCGYAIAEDRSIVTGLEDSTVEIAFKVLMHYHRARFESGDNVFDCIASIEELAKKAYSRDDPFAGLYYYLCFELARYVPSFKQSDGAVYLSRGFKYLQKRAKAITDNTIREQFLKNPVWNSRVYHAARENMLI